MSFINNKKVLIIVSISLTLIDISSLGLAYYFYTNNDSNCEVQECDCNIQEELSVMQEDDSSTFFAEIKGSVVNPGVYEVSENSIINDLVSLAGGFTSKAYTNNINLSKKVSSEMVVYVFTKTEYKNKNNKNDDNTTNTCVTADYNIDNCTNNYSSVIISGSDSTISTESDNESVISSSNEHDKENQLININTATKEELMTLPGIGETKALAIINYRNENGLFKSIEDITNVSGIGASTLENFKSLITVQ